MKVLTYLPICFLLMIALHVDKADAMRRRGGKVVVDTGKRILPRLLGDVTPRAKRGAKVMRDRTIVKKARERRQDISQLKQVSQQIAAKYVYVPPDHPEHDGLYGVMKTKQGLTNRFIGVLSTKIFCRFGCPARIPLAKNTVFASRPVDLIALGMRECKRCHPLSHAASDEVQTFLRSIETSAVPAKITPRPIHPASRWVLEEEGVDLVRYVQVKRVMNILENNHEVKFRPQTVFRYQKYWTPLGFMIGCFSEKGLCLLEFMDRRALESELLDVQRRLKARFREEETERSHQLGVELAEYFRGERMNFGTPLHLLGSRFQLSVWNVLQTVLYGSVSTYKDQALKLQKASAMRAVANANGANRISILVPCHRIIGSNGKLTGYGGGLDRKQYLINLEAISRDGDDDIA